MEADVLEAIRQWLMRVAVDDSHGPIRRQDLLYLLGVVRPEVPRAIVLVSAGDLPLLTGMASTADIPESIALDPLPARVAEMRARLAAVGPRPWIGVTWRAGVQEENRLSKVAPQDALARALSGTHATLIALQRNPEPGEIDRFAAIADRPLADLTAFNDDLEGMLALLWP